MLGWLKLVTALVFLAYFAGLVVKDSVTKDKEEFSCSAAKRTLQNSLDCMNLPYCRMTATELNTFRYLLKERRAQCGHTPNIEIDGLAADL